MKKYTIDRFEGEYAVLEDFENNNMINVLISELPDGCEEGDILEYNNGIYIILSSECKMRKESIQDRFKRLTKK